MNKIHSVEIIEVKKHPHATRLNICLVSDGEKQTQVVCGASNLKLGLKTMLAPVNSITPNGLEIKKTNLRGVESNGMLCSAKDLGINNEKGIIDLPPETKLNTDLESINSQDLSSTPWYQYKKVEELRLNSQNKIQVFRKDFDKLTGELVSETYFFKDKYFYRSF